MRQRLIRYWWLWLALAALAIVANELFDRGTSSGSHPAADILIAIAVVLIAAFVWEAVARRRARRAS